MEEGQKAHSTRTEHQPAAGGGGAACRQVGAPQRGDAARVGEGGPCPGGERRYCPRSKDETLIRRAAPVGSNAMSLEARNRNTRAEAKPNQPRGARTRSVGMGALVGLDEPLGLK